MQLNSHFSRMIPQPKPLKFAGYHFTEVKGSKKLGSFDFETVNGDSQVVRVTQDVWVDDDEKTYLDKINNREKCFGELGIRKSDSPRQDLPQMQDDAKQTMLEEARSQFMQERQPPSASRSKTSIASSSSPQTGSSSRSFARIKPGTMSTVTIRPSQPETMSTVTIGPSQPKTKGPKKPVPVRKGRDFFSNIDAMLAGKP